jgi:hypothetical protein
MPTTQADDAAVREQAYYFWEEAGRPAGREAEFWMLAVAAVTEKGPVKKPAKPKAVAKDKAKPATKAKVMAVKSKAGKPVLQAAASKTKAAPAKAEPAKKPKKK